MRSLSQDRFSEWRVFGEWRAVAANLPMLDRVVYRMTADNESAATAVRERRAHTARPLEPDHRPV
jgi:hypothetical protein